MKKNLLLLIALCSTTGLFAETFSLSNFYIDGFTGVNLMHIPSHKNSDSDLNTGYVLGGSFGYKFSDFFRLEAEGAYRHNSTNKHIPANNINIALDIEKGSLMANAILEIPLLDNALIPYCGFGGGQIWSRAYLTATSDVANLFASKKDSTLGYQGIGGLTFCVGNKIRTALEYHYFTPQNQGHFTDHSIGLNIKRSF